MRQQLSSPQAQPLQIQASREFGDDYMGRSEENDRQSPEKSLPSHSSIIARLDAIIQRLSLPHALRQSNQHHREYQADFMRPFEENHQPEELRQSLEKSLSFSSALADARHQLSSLRSLLQQNQHRRECQADLKSRSEDNHRPERLRCSTGIYIFSSPSYTNPFDTLPQLPSFYQYCAEAMRRSEENLQLFMEEIRRSTEKVRRAMEKHERLNAISLKYGRPETPYTD